MSRRLVLAGIAIALLLLSSCWNSRHPEPDSLESLEATVSVDKKRVRLGEEIRIEIDDVPPGWSGEVTVNNLRHFQFQSKVYVLEATIQNGFNKTGASDVFVLLNDSKGYEIPVNLDHFQIMVEDKGWSVAPEISKIGPDGGTGVVHVTAPRGQEWSVTGVPDWIRFPSGGKGVGERALDFTAAENTTNEHRLARMSIGDALFQVSQARTSVIVLPFRETFGTLPMPVWTLDPRLMKAGIELPSRWVLDDQSGRYPAVHVTEEAPGGGHSLVLDRQRAAKDAWRGQVYILGIRTEVGAKYRVSVWLKAEHPAPVWLTLGQSTAPHTNCGLSQRVSISRDWTEYTAPFRATGTNCGAANNRLAIEGGLIAGKLWIAKLTMTRE